MKITLRIPVKKAKKKLRVSRSFKTRSEVTERTAAVGEAFGIGVDEEKEFHLYRDFEVDVKPGDVVYITGESGSGKSVLLRELTQSLSNPPSEGGEVFGQVTSDSELKIDPDEILVDGVGEDVNEALRCLSLAGLNDAFLFVRRYRELSEGQKYRYKIAKMIASNVGVWIFDDFTALLDRDTAKIVAFCLQKAARRGGRTVIAASTHEDLLEDLAPSIHIRKGWGEEVSVEYHAERRRAGWLNINCSLTRGVKIREGSFKDYKNLAHLHYRAGRPWSAKKIFIIELNGRAIGCIVYSTPPYHAAGRRRFLGYTPKIHEVNRDFLCISRVILHPKFRSIGLGVKIVHDTLPLTGSRYVEAIAVMAKFNPFLTKAGMIEVPVESSFTEECRRELKGLEPYGFDPKYCGSVHYSLKVLNSLTEGQYSEMASHVRDSPRIAYISRGKVLRGLEDRNVVAKLIRDLAVKSQSKKYYIWENLEIKRSISILG